MSLLDIHVLGSPILRQVTRPVETVTDEMRRLIDDMIETMYVAKGVGLAAPQVGRAERIAVIDVGDERGAAEPPARPPEAKPEPAPDPIATFRNDEIIRRALEIFRGEIQPA